MRVKTAHAKNPHARTVFLKKQRKKIQRTHCMPNTYLTTNTVSKESYLPECSSLKCVVCMYIYTVAVHIANTQAGDVYVLAVPVGCDHKTLSFT